MFRLVTFIASILLYYVYPTAGQQLSAVTTNQQELADSLLSFIADEKKLTRSLGLEMDVLEMEMNKLKAFRQNVTCGCDPLPNPVVFSTTMQNNTQLIGIGQELIFDTVGTNVGNGYDVRHGTFTAPVDGVYEFSFSVHVEGATVVGLDLKKNGVVIARSRSSQDSYGYYNMATNMVVVELKAGDDVWIEHTTADSNTIFGRSLTSFSGQLILPYTVKQTK
ncbi:hypothetical protein CHS0354_029854 [Potamilus streckersoni]|uniref:C1q domain-containing protein n=1 Tax=Potamilus streckersoni TaxID=2493646 RepID=A0AAE0TG76_9BIVA|nr:hypothetical protein CHS0354_029854 [Potamilus streckersoni]